MNNGDRTDFLEALFNASAGNIFWRMEKFINLKVLPFLRSENDG